MGLAGQGIRGSELVGPLAGQVLAGGDSDSLGHAGACGQHAPGGLLSALSVGRDPRGDGMRPPADLCQREDDLGGRASDFLSSASWARGFVLLSDRAVRTPFRTEPPQHQVRWRLHRNTDYSHAIPLGARALRARGGSVCSFLLGCGQMACDPEPHWIPSYPDALVPDTGVVRTGAGHENRTAEMVLLDRGCFGPWVIYV